MLLSLGSIGLLVQLYKSRLIFPGVVGALALLLAFYSLQTLPVNYTGLLLIGLGMVMFILGNQGDEFWHALPGWYCRLSMSPGSLDADPPEEYLRIPLATIVLVVGTHGGPLPLFVVGAAVRSVGRQARERTGRHARRHGTVKGRLDLTGTVFVQGTLWSARRHCAY